MKKLSPSVTLKTVGITDENGFLSAAQASHGIHKHWVKVPITAIAFKRYVKEMNMADDMAYLIRREDNGSLVGVVELQDIFVGDFKNAYIIYYTFLSHQRLVFMTVAVQ